MDSKKEISKKAFNKQASTYDCDIKGQHARMLYPYLLEKLEKINYNTILDVGCGTGEMLSIILKENKQKEAHGLDLSPNMVQVAKDKLQNKAQIVEGDSEHLPYSNNYFDVVCCNDSFHHYPNPDNVLKEIFRVLKDGGYFILGDTWQPFIGRMIMNSFMKFSQEGDVKMYSEDEITKMLKKHFTNVQWKRINNTSYICTAVKNLK